jgi:hypothetical protein
VHVICVEMRRHPAGVPDLTVAQPSGDKHLDRLAVGAIWQIQVLAQWLG